MVDAFNRPGRWQPFGPFSPIAAPGAGRILHLKGQVALDRDGHIVGAGDMRAQLHQVLENIRAALASVGGEMRDILSMTNYVTDMDAFPAAADIRRAFLAALYRVTTPGGARGLSAAGCLGKSRPPARTPPGRFRRP